MRINREKENLLVHSELLEMLRYDSDTGIFTWIKPKSNCMKSGDIAGTLLNTGYVQLRINNVKYQAHRVAWFYVTKNWPENILDHIDGIRSNNIFNNLRQATEEQNLKNTGIRKNNTSGYKGVSFNKLEKKFMARITIDKKRKFLGYFDTAELAHIAYTNAIPMKDKEFHR